MNFLAAVNKKHGDLSNAFSAIDLHFGRFMMELSGDFCLDFFLAAALVSRETREGHVCLDIKTVAGRPLSADTEGSVILPKLERWIEVLEKRKAVGKPGEYRPLILDDKFRLYMYRYWDYEKRLADFIVDRVRRNDLMIATDAYHFKTVFDHLFPMESSAGGEINPHRIAALLAVKRQFLLISGGPGTGKTTMAAKILALLIELADDRKKMLIALAAPTGKAAVRLQEAVIKAVNSLSFSEKVRAMIPQKATTIHRLLVSQHDSPYFYYNAENKLPVDVVIVDEASMIDLPLMSKLVQSLPASAKLIILGDKDQLSSVEAGAVLGDICGSDELYGRNLSSFVETANKCAVEDITKCLVSRNMPTGINECVVQLQKNYRFDLESGIGVLTKAINSGDVNCIFEIITSNKYKDVKGVSFADQHDFRFKLKEMVINVFDDYLHLIMTEKNYSVIFKYFDRFRILCALRQGPFGADAINRFVEQVLEEKNLIRPQHRWYLGRPVMITRNDYNLRLFNGDTGIILSDTEANGAIKAFFRNAAGEFRSFYPSVLPEHETAYAMTVHKSQGSEFDNIILILPDRDSPALTRELLYTAITRVREKVEIWGNENIIRNAVSRRIERASGLRDILYPSPV